MERIRDFLFDISDLLISLLIIAAIFMVISWKLNESIPIDTSLALQTAETPAPTQDSQADATPTDTVSDDLSEPNQSTDATDADKPITIEPTLPKSETGKEVTVKIPEGSPGVAIGKILKDNGLITDVNTFIKKVDEMSLGPKLRSGTFKLKTSMGLEEVIKIIANVK